MTAMPMLQMRRKMHLVPRDAFDFHQNGTDQNKPRSREVEGENGGVEIDVGEADAADESEIEQEGDCAYWQTLDRFIEAEKVYETCEEAVPEQCKYELGREMLQFLDECVVHERRCKEEYPERDACAAENHKLCFHCMELLFIENASACVERRRKKNVSVASGKRQRLGESPQRHNGDPEKHAQRAEDVLFLQFLSQHGDSQKHEENILRADEELGIDRSRHPQSRECKERRDDAVTDAD